MPGILPNRPLPEPAAPLANPDHQPLRTTTDRTQFAALRTLTVGAREDRIEP